MKITRIRDKDNKKLDRHVLEQIAKELELKAAMLGFIHYAYVDGSSIRTGINSKSFVINTGMLGHNGRVGRFVDSVKGYKRTNLPTWEQRVAMNHLVNDVLDSYEVSANVKSGNYIVRTSSGDRVSSWPDGGQLGKHFYGAFGRSDEILTEKDAREAMQSDKLEAEHKAKLKVKRAKVRAEKKFKNDLKNVLK